MSLVFFLVFLLGRPAMLTKFGLPLTIHAFILKVQRNHSLDDVMNNSSSPQNNGENKFSKDNNLKQSPLLGVSQKKKIVFCTSKKLMSVITMNSPLLCLHRSALARLIAQCTGVNHCGLHCCHKSTGTCNIMMEWTVETQLIVPIECCALNLESAPSVGCTSVPGGTRVMT